MQKQTSIYIPKPCHEDWNKMTPTQQGKFCSSCNKQVIDFSLMSDNQILNLLSNQSGKLCGRFDAEQLQRPLTETKIKKKKSWWMALTMPLLFLFDRSNAQEISNKIDTITQVEERKDLIVGKLSYDPIKQVIIKGKVIDENENPLAYATIIQKGTIHETTTDSLGNFSINASSYEDSITLAVSYIGFTSTEKRINISDLDINNVVISLKEQSIGLSEVVVVGEAFTGRLGGLVSVCSRITYFQKIDTTFKLAFGISKIYPNPATKGGNIHLQIKQPGAYKIQLLDDQSRLIQSEEINVDTKNTTTQIQLQSNTSSGIYYLRLINEQKKKSYTEKLIIQ